MAIRYSGDLKIVIRYEMKKRFYRVSVSSLWIEGKSVANGTLYPNECQLLAGEDRTSPEAYDKVARRVLKFLVIKRVKTGDLRRVFQAPCPVSGE